MVAPPFMSSRTTYQEKHLAQGKTNMPLQTLLKKEIYDTNPNTTILHTFFNSDMKKVLSEGPLLHYQTVLIGNVSLPST